MTYLSLNRRHRPRSFAEVTRQEHVTRTLRNAITQGRIAQAYLFGGLRGTGKTTMARLLAMCLNCRAGGGDSDPGPTAEPCGECASCQSVIGGSSPDVIELDAASNRGIDEIRALQENVHLAPMSGRYKVYIIDEAHQMTKDAYNAFLKTLEEPPRHVIFVLATTEPEKIIPTVRSRCQRFDFRPIPDSDLMERLREVAGSEGVQATDGLLKLIARKAEGSVRDALGLLEQCVAFAGERPTEADFLTVTGGVARDGLRRLIEAVRDGRPADALAQLDELVRSGRDPTAVSAGLTGYLRDVFLAGLSPDTADPELSGDRSAWPTQGLIRFIDALARADADMRYSPQPRLILEMALLGLGLTQAQAGEGSGSATPNPAPPATASPAPAATPDPEPRATPDPEPRATPDPDPAPPEGPSPAPATSQAPASAEAETTWLRENWDDVLDRVKRKSIFVRAFLEKAAPYSRVGDLVTLTFEAQFHKEQMEQPKNRQHLEEALSEAAGTPVRVVGRLSPTSWSPAKADPPPVTRPEVKEPDRGPAAGPGQGSSLGQGQGPVPASEGVRNALTIFGGRVIDGTDAKPGRR